MINPTFARVAIAAFALTAASVPAFAVDIRGVWQSSEGVVNLSMPNGLNGEFVQGTYGNDGGQIVGSFFDGRLLRGHWMENSSAMRCSEPMTGLGPTPGTNAEFWYWGEVELGFSDGAFSGRWGYCGPGGGNGWVGNR